MKSIDDIIVASEQVQALKDLKDRLLDKFNIEDVVIYGSVARSQADNESDFDLLILTTYPVTRFERHKITDVIFEVNLHYGTNFSSLVVDHVSWQSGPISVLPIYDEVCRDGIRL